MPVKAQTSSRGQLEVGRRPEQHTNAVAGMQEVSGTRIPLADIMNKRSPRRRDTGLVAAARKNTRHMMRPSRDMLKRFCMGLAQWRQNRELLQILIQWGGNFSMARRKERKR